MSLSALDWGYGYVCDNMIFSRSMKSEWKNEIKIELLLLLLPYTTHNFSSTRIKQQPRSEKKLLE